MAPGFQRGVGTARLEAGRGMSFPARASAADITCAGCGTRFAKNVSWLKNNSVVPCPGCGKPIHVRRYKAQAGAAKLFEKLTGFAGGSKGS